MIMLTRMSLWGICMDGHTCLCEVYVWMAIHVFVRFMYGWPYFPLHCIHNIRLVMCFEWGVVGDVMSMCLAADSNPRPKYTTIIIKYLLTPISWSLEYTLYHIIVSCGECTMLWPWSDVSVSWAANPSLDRCSSDTYTCIYGYITATKHLRSEWWSSPHVHMCSDGVLEKLDRNTLLLPWWHHYYVNITPVHQIALSCYHGNIATTLTSPLCIKWCSCYHGDIPMSTSPQCCVVIHHVCCAWDN